jgi:hypothetical protein
MVQASQASQRLYRPALGVQTEYVVGYARLMAEIGQSAPQSHALVASLTH